ncbi:restriction endonuclease subunit S [Pseudomonas sp. PA-6-1D]|uniref:restriction endonuclease subunit S n=1 Tax=Pseudomonas TaxID=286 RepID=UPI001EF14BD4|nr:MULTISPECIES: restriction endonuclease subunit S [Pseudomonas]MCF5144400.1 restriction endonuclease subunit S [Pseudomonas sp. PA-6-3C]MCF5148722.1 restriction endonuclease subunit S [Pseudomonas sp. PA-6-3F]MCF5160418.1 restriction endonuclease subunit S [Pseudomonas sp. PA-6-2E]MCF5176694.1 restriction endonuclease subunit S [Pseudomonas sp. PA-6-1D]MCF5194271.1 restriction endonuclease subunit S [Pseudomonas sp. PA-6-1H]
MTTEWRRGSVGELQKEGLLLVEDGNHGEIRPRHDEFSESGNCFFIRAADMDGGRVLFESAQKINDMAFRRIRKGIGKGGDVLFSHKGTVGKLAVAPLDSPPFVCSPQTTFWRTLDESQLDRRFLYYYMQSRDFVEQWMSRKGETDMADYVSLTAQRQFEVAIPPIEDQRAIASVLGALDDKIEQNRRANRALEELAQATFRAWFVDFEPVKTKAAGQSSFPGMPPTVFSALADRLTDSSIGFVPEGWAVRPIGDLVTVKGGGTPSTKVPAYWEGGKHFWATPKDLSGLQDPVLLSTGRSITDAGADSISSGVMPKNTVLLSSRAPVGYIALAKTPVAINQGFIAMICDGPLPPHYILHWTRSALEEIKSRASGTTFPEISKTAFRPIPAVVPDRIVVEAFERFAQSLFDIIEENVRQSNRLTDLRDYLIPRLLCGAVRVKP